MANIPPATRPARSAARASSISHPAPPTTSSPLSPTRVARPTIPRKPPAPIPPTGRRSPATRSVSGGTGSISQDRPPSAADSRSPERPSSQTSFHAALVRETEEKESLLLKVQEHEGTIVTLHQQQGTLTSALQDAETRLQQLYDEQMRMEDELASRNVVTEKLRAEVRELEREERDLRKRYNDQSQTFEAERQTFYDSEQHLKSRIQSLTQARKQQRDKRRSIVEGSDSGAAANGDEADAEGSLSLREKDPEALADVNEDDEGNDVDTPEMIALKLELSTLTTSNGSLQSTMQLLQTQLQDLQRVNKELQEENESYNTLLLERTMAGQFDIRNSVPSSAIDDDRHGDGASMHGTVRSVAPILDVITELKEREEAEPSPVQLEFSASLNLPSLTNSELPPRSTSPDSHRTGKRSARKAGSTRASSPKGESLADLPVAGPGLDLAAELGRAQSKDPEIGFTEEQPAVRAPPPIDYKEVEDMRKELKNLRDANKALSLYSSKILDKIIGHGGFESILAADGEPRSPTVPPVTRRATSATAATHVSTPSTGGGFFRALGENVSLPFSPGANTAGKPTMADSSTSSNPTSSTPSTSEPLTKRARRGLSIDWSKISIWASPGATKDKEVDDETNIKPPSPEKPTPTQTVPVIGIARKLEKQDDEDEEDRKLRDRLNAEMRLLGIEKELVSSPIPNGAPADVPGSSSISVKSLDRENSGSKSSNGNGAVTPNPAASGSTTPLSFKSRLPFFRSSSAQQESTTPPILLTSEALQQAEVEANIVAYEAREKAQIDELARNASSSSRSGANSTPGSPASFTEMPSVRPGSSLSERHRRRRAGNLEGVETMSSGSTSGNSVSARSGASTLFSAGRLSMDHQVGEEAEE